MGRTQRCWAQDTGAWCWCYQAAPPPGQGHGTPGGALPRVSLTMPTGLLRNSLPSIPMPTFSTKGDHT